MSWPGGPNLGAHPEPEQLAEYAGGDMEARRARGIAAHLETCEQCSREVEEYAGMLGLLNRLPRYAAPRSFLLDELSVRRRSRPSSVPAWASLVASVVFALGMLGALAGGSGGGAGGGNSAAMNAASESQAGSASGTDATDGYGEPESGSATTGGMGGAGASVSDEATIAAASSQQEDVAIQAGSAAQATVATGVRSRSSLGATEAALPETTGGGTGATSASSAGQPEVGATQVVSTTADAPGADATLTSDIALVPGPTSVADTTAASEPAAPVGEDEAVRYEYPARGRNLAAIGLGTLSGLALLLAVYFFLRARLA